MNSILLNVPSELKTERLLLRAPSYTGDAEAVNRAVEDSIQELRQWLPFAREVPTLEETEISLREAHIKFLERENFRFLIFQKDAQAFIGTVSLQSVDWEVQKCEIGYWINTKFGGNGYITEAVKAVTAYGINELGFRRLEIRCESTNLPSRAIPEKLGFNLEGILVNEDLSADGKTLTDTCIYAITQKINRRI
ncbi:GNAT family N-acetyltransferase [Planococcus donghaensis]|nr:GNAT family N-acetyltransferase [Planococcus donghaensis]